MPETNVLDDPEVKAAIAKLQGKYDTKLADLTKSVETLTKQRDELASAADSIPDDEPDTSPKVKGVVATLKNRAASIKEAANEAARQAESRELAKHKAATGLFIKYSTRGVKLEDLLALDDELSMREHVISVLEATTVSAETKGRVNPANAGITGKTPAHGTKPNFLNEAVDLLEEGHREGRVVFKTQSFDN